VPRRFLASPTPRADADGEESLGATVLKKVMRAIAKTRPIVLEEKIHNTDRSIGAKVSGHIARLHGNAGLPEKTVDLIFHGSAGQSFGAFTIAGMKLTVIGEANDYVGKGMAGGEIVIRPPQEVQFDWSENVIIGNTVLYGATGGALFAAGRAGERFAVRNSGAVAVVEGVGDHGCEYMTAGVVVVLGEVGRNFGAGMTGGVAYVLDENSSFEKQCNQELVRLAPVSSLQDQMVLRLLIQRHYELTGSPRALKTLWKWDEHKGMFWQVITQGAQAMRKLSVVENAGKTEKPAEPRSGKAIAVNS
jgi:glutamate synthase (ferredoxin)